MPFMKPHSVSRPALYSPKLVCALSLLFTPIFGALLQSQNWIALGEPDRAAASRHWVRTTLWMLVLYLALQVFFRDEPIMNWMGPYFLLVLWAAWMITSGWKQLSVIKSRFGDAYERRPIGKAITLGVGGWVLYGAISLTVALALMLLGIEPAQKAPEYGVVISMPEGAKEPVVTPLPPPDAAAPQSKAQAEPVKPESASTPAAPAAP